MGFANAAINRALSGSQVGYVDQLRSGDAEFGMVSRCY
ncbi:hypothetical protein GAPWKB30_1941 [Gilliamella apicola]|nr:hypothetical protein GAPWKB30_1941 [Gilliamella apicola]